MSKQVTVFKVVSFTFKLNQNRLDEEKGHFTNGWGLL